MRATMEEEGRRGRKGNPPPPPKMHNSRPHGDPLSPGLIDGQNEGAFETQASAPFTYALV